MTHLELTQIQRLLELAKLSQKEQQATIKRLRRWLLVMALITAFNGIVGIAGLFL